LIAGFFNGGRFLGEFSFVKKKKNREVKPPFQDTTTSGQSGNQTRDGLKKRAVGLKK
jgi:hypothetical protein